MEVLAARDVQRAVDHHVLGRDGAEDHRVRPQRSESHAEFEVAFEGDGSARERRQGKREQFVAEELPAECAPAF